MEIIDIYNRAGSWLDASGPLCDIVVSSRIRLARNVAGYDFYGHASPSERTELHEHIRDRVMDSPFKDDLWYIPMGDTAPLQRQMLAERHVISRQLAEEDSGPCGVALAHDESLALMINEEDHLRIQVLASGLQLDEQFDRIEKVDNMLEERLSYAFSPDLGYLTACPTNVGTGMRVSVMLHLPALKLAGQIEKVFQAVKSMRLAIRGLYGEGSEPIGDMYQLSNQTTLGRTEPQLIKDLVTNAVEPIVKYERRARAVLQDQRCTQLEDKIFRARGVLASARMISSEETLYMLSYLRLGVYMGRIKDIGIDAISRLMQLTRPAHLQYLTGKELAPEDRDIARADFIRQNLI